MPKTVVITGASAGLGAGIAGHLAVRGYSLVLAARTREALDRVANEAMRRGAPHAIAVETDVTKRGDVERLRDRAVDALGAFDVWINNAGRGITRPALELTDDDFDYMMAVNVKSALYGMQVAVPHFIERGGRGHIINMSSFLGRVPVATYRSAYNAAKAALNTLTANARVDLQKTYPDIHITLVMPGMVATGFGQHALYSPPGTPPYSGPYVQPVEDVAALIARVVEEPVAEVYTNPASASMAQRYFADVGAFEAQGVRWGSEPASAR
ncbi:MAG TPA: SDR family oxidoreductase [Gemmatimonadaceae bacterium]|jgi:short-subunit dehydrogenase|nr:SDR family oxidoreductase [Gemmatimonadaceae bacterium]